MAEEQERTAGSCTKTLWKVLDVFAKKLHPNVGIALIEKEQDFLSTILNMGDQQKLSKLYAHCAYKEIERIYQ